MKQNLLTDFKSAGISESDWESYLETKRQKIIPSITNKMHSTERCFTVNGQEIKSAYDGDTQYKNYCKFINSVLRSIRNKQHDYCYYIYQVLELLRFENQRLVAKWISKDKCFEVWLED